MTVGSSTRLAQVGAIDLPVHVGSGGFDHAAVHGPRKLLYVAHTANDALDVIDLQSERYVRSIANLKGVAGALIDEPSDLVFTSNRGENTVGIFHAGDENVVQRVQVGNRPNGLAYDPDRKILLCANVGVSEGMGSHSISLVDVIRSSVPGEVAVPGRTRWAVFDPGEGLFFVNIADPPRIEAIDPSVGATVRFLEVPATGPHGLDFDFEHGRLYCACDEGVAVSLDARSGRILGKEKLSGAPDVVFLNHKLRRLYVAVGDPGVIDVLDVDRWHRVETVVTEPGAHTIAFDRERDRVYAFLPNTHRATVYQDRA